MEVDPGFLQFLKGLESFERMPYLDSGGVLTIGIGHVITKGERLSGKIVINGVHVKYRDGLNDGQIYTLYRQDARIAVDVINSFVTAPLSQHQFNALVSFVFNIGVTAFIESTLLKVLNRGDYQGVPNQMARWKYDNGVIVEGLVNRRKKEIDLWNKGEQNGQQKVERRVQHDRIAPDR